MSTRLWSGHRTCALVGTRLHDSHGSGSIHLVAPKASTPYKLWLRDIVGSACLPAAEPNRWYCPPDPPSAPRSRFRLAPIRTLHSSARLPLTPHGAEAARQPALSMETKNPLTMSFRAYLPE